MNKNLKLVACTFVAAFLTAAVTPAQTIQIPGLSNTGVTTPGGTTLVTPIPSIDPNWMLAFPSPTTSSNGPTPPNGPSSLNYAAAFVNPPNSAWKLNGPNSQWITPPNRNSAGGDLFYQTTFDIPAGFDPFTATISGLWTTDNEGLGVFLNNTPISGLSLPGPTSFDPAMPYTPFLLNSSNATFKSGTNKLHFEVRNRGVGGIDTNPTDTGLRVEFNSALSTVSVPEPATIGFGVALLGICAGTRRRK